MSIKAFGVIRDRSGVVVPGGTVKFYQGATLIGTATANAYGKWEISLAAGTYDVKDNDGDWVRSVVFVDTAASLPAWTTGVVAPSDAAGSNGDFYTDSVAGKVYYKSGGVWAAVVNFTPGV